MKTKHLKNGLIFGICALLLGTGSRLTTPLPTRAATEPDEKLIALTFDDGPNTITTNEVLDILEQYDAVGSFFLIGDNINEESAVSVKRAYEMGCEINNHSKTHSYMSSMSEVELAAEIDPVSAQIYDITGEYPHFFRPPFITTSQTMYDAIDLPFICGFDCKDYMENVTAADRSDAILNAAKDGLIVLLHDAAGNTQTVEALKTVVPTLQAEGYRFVTLSELFALQGETPQQDLIYSEVTKYPCGGYTLRNTLYSGEASGTSSWTGWSSLVVLDGAELEALGDTYAIEIDYDSTTPPVIALQAWSENSFWATVTPSYFNGARACFLASDVQAVLDANNIRLTELNKITVVPYDAEMTLTEAKLLVNTQPQPDVEHLRLQGIMRFLVRREAGSADYDVNSDRQINAFDAVAQKRVLLT